jgi:hypothetical protein
METLLPIVKEFGFPVALCIVLLFAIRQQNAQLVKAFTDRIKVLEKVVEEQGEEIVVIQNDRMHRADEYAHTLRDIAARYAKVVTDHDAWSKQAFALLSRLIDVWQMRPCMADRYEPHTQAPVQPPTQKVPSSAEIPAPPQHTTPSGSHPTRTQG